MSIAKVILEEELENLERQLKRNVKEYEDLPSGSIRMKKINGREYPYRQYKERGKVISIAIKKNEDIEVIKFRIQKRKKVKEKVREIKMEIVAIEISLKHINS